MRSKRSPGHRRSRSPRRVRTRTPLSRALIRAVRAARGARRRRRSRDLAAGERGRDRQRARCRYTRRAPRPRDLGLAPEVRGEQPGVAPGLKTPGSRTIRIMASYPDPSPETLDRREPCARPSTRVAPLTVGIEEEAMLARPGHARPRCRARPRCSSGSAATRASSSSCPPRSSRSCSPPATTVAESARGAGERPAASSPPPAERIGRARRGRRAPARAAARRAQHAASTTTAIAAEYGAVAELQGVCALQVHVAVGGADRALAVYNALRSHLPELAALAANAPFYAGATPAWPPCGRRSATLLPAPGRPARRSRAGTSTPRRSRWGEAAGALPTPGAGGGSCGRTPRTGRSSCACPTRRRRWPTPPRSRRSPTRSVAWLAERHDAGDLPAPRPTWRIEENRWPACRHGARRRAAPTCAPASARPPASCSPSGSTSSHPTAARLGCAAELGAARGCVERNGADAPARAAGEPRRARRGVARRRASSD